MKFIAVIACLCLTASAPLVVVAQEEATISAYSVVAGKTVNVNIVKVERTPMSYQSFYTLMNGNNF